MKTKFSPYKFTCPSCNKDGKVRIEILNTAECFVVEGIDPENGGLLVTEHGYKHKPNAEVLDDGLYCSSCGAYLERDNWGGLQWDEVLETLGTEFENTPSAYFVDEIKGISGASRIEHCDALANLLKIACGFLAHGLPNEKKLAQVARKALDKAGYAKRRAS